MANLRKQVPSVEGNWLHNGLEDYTRTFAKVVYLGVDAKEWDECTDDEKIAFEEAHPAPQPEE